MPRMENQGGDRLARGAVSHTFRPAGEKLSREQWADIFDGKAERTVKAVYILHCPLHGENETDRECFVSGGFPQLDEKLVVKCKIDDCTETATYAGHRVTSIEPAPEDRCGPGVEGGDVSLDAGEAVSS